MKHNPITMQSQAPAVQLSQVNEQQDKSIAILKSKKEIIVKPSKDIQNKVDCNETDPIIETLDKHQSKSIKASKRMTNEKINSDDDSTCYTKASVT